MLIGIDGSRAFLRNRTGIEEYSYQVIKNLRGVISDHQVVLYIRGDQEVDFNLPENWKVKKINRKLFWTQAGLSLEMVLHPIDALFVPAHTVPFVHPKKTIVTIHGLEYEFCPTAYSWWEQVYMHFIIKKSCRWSSAIVSVSENTKKDLMRLYGIPEGKIKVVYEGYEESHQTSVISNQSAGYRLPVTGPYLLFIGRIEERKNVGNVVRAFEILKEKYKLEHELILAGKPGYGHEDVEILISNSKFKDDIVETGYVSEGEKWRLLEKADCFVFPTRYEGFGIPVLEAQSMGCPVVSSNNSAIPEVTICHSGLDPESSAQTRISKQVQADINSNRVCSGSALLVDPQNILEIAEAIYKIISDQTFKKDLIEKGLENVKRFSWEKCAREVGEILKK